MQYSKSELKEISNFVRAKATQSFIRLCVAQYPHGRGSVQKEKMVIEDLQSWFDVSYQTIRKYQQFGIPVNRVERLLDFASHYGYSFKFYRHQFMPKESALVGYLDHHHSLRVDCHASRFDFDGWDKNRRFGEGTKKSL